MKGNLDYPWCFCGRNQKCSVCKMLNVNGKLPGTAIVEVSGMSDEHVLQKVLSVVTTVVKTVPVIGKSSVPGAGVGVRKVFNVL